MGRGRDKKIQLSDIPNMAPGELNAAIAKSVRIEGTAVVRDKRGNAKYDGDATPGKYHEDKL